MYISLCFVEWFFHFTGATTTEHLVTCSSFLTFSVFLIWLDWCDETFLIYFWLQLQKVVTMEHSDVTTLHVSLTFDCISLALSLSLCVCVCCLIFVLNVVFCFSLQECVQQMKCEMAQLKVFDWFPFLSVLSFHS